MNGKNKCRILKQIRAEIAKSNGIEYAVEACPHKGECAGTCPKCEAEVRRLEKALARRASAGKRVLLAGVAAGIALSSAACAAPQATSSIDASIIENYLRRQYFEAEEELPKEEEAGKLAEQDPALLAQELKRIQNLIFLSYIGGPVYISSEMMTKKELEAVKAYLAQNNCPEELTDEAFEELLRFIDEYNAEKAVENDPDSAEEQTPSEWRNRGDDNG